MKKANWFKAMEAEIAKYTAEKIQYGNDGFTVYLGNKNGFDYELFFEEEEGGVGMYIEQSRPDGERFFDKSAQAMVFCKMLLDDMDVFYIDPYTEEEDQLMRENISTVFGYFNDCI